MHPQTTATQARRAGPSLDQPTPARSAPEPGLGHDQPSAAVEARRAGASLDHPRPARAAPQPGLGLDHPGPAVQAWPRGFGLYQVKPAFQARLAGLADLLAARGVHPDVLTFAGVGCGLAGGAALAAGLVLNQPALLAAVPPAAFARLTCNALDGMVAIRAGKTRPWGKVLNEFCDRIADLAFLAPLLLVQDSNPTLVTAALCTTLLVSYLGVLAEAAGAPRQYGGVLGKADRMLFLGLATAATAATGSPVPLQLLPYVLLIGGALTLMERGKQTHAAL